MVRARLWRIAWCAAALLLVASVGVAQRRGLFGAPPKMATRADFDGAFLFCRVAFRGNRYGDGGNWAVDYPRADINFPFRLSEFN